MNHHLPTPMVCLSLPRVLLVGLVAASAPLAGATVPALAPDGSETAIRLPRNPSISADGQRIAFAWQGDVWTASIDGGEASRLTIHPANDGTPIFSPDGTPATQVTFDSASKTLHDITADGSHLLISQSTDRGWHYSESGRAFLVDVTGETPKRMRFDAGVRDAAM